MAQKIKKSDAQIHHDVLEELKWDTRVRETDVGVEVSSGIVTLTGTVGTWTARLAAQEAAHRVAGVLDVANEVHVKVAGSYERDDTDIARAVRSALEWDVRVPHERIRTTVSKGVVTLEGTVDCFTQLDDAANAVRHLAGVRDVKNLVVVEPSPPHVSVEAVREAIQDALDRHADHSAKHVSIVVQDGVVTLNGNVPSWAERRALEGAARGTPGVRKVDNHLTIQA